MVLNELADVTGHFKGGTASVSFLRHGCAQLWPVARSAGAGGRETPLEPEVMAGLTYQTRAIYRFHHSAVAIYKQTIQSGKV